MTWVFSCRSAYGVTIHGIRTALARRGFALNANHHIGIYREDRSEVEDLNKISAGQVLRPPNRQERMMSKHHSPDSSIPLRDLPLIVLFSLSEKTSFIFKPGPYQKALANAIINKYGEPEWIKYDDSDPPKLWMLLPHRNLEPKTIELAEKFTTWMTLYKVGANDLCKNIEGI